MDIKNEKINYSYVINVFQVEEAIGLTRVKPLGAPLAGTSLCMNGMLEQQVVELTRQIEDLKIRYRYGCILFILNTGFCCCSNVLLCPLLAPYCCIAN